MKTYAQIIDNKVYGIFNYEVLPQFHKDIVMIDITGRTDVVVGMEYDGTIFISQTLPTLDELKLEKIKHLQDKYQKEYDAYLAQYPKREVDSFPVKQAEAIAYNLDNTAPTPIIDAIVSKNGAAKDDYVASILTKVTALAAQEGEMVAIRDSIKACTIQDELDAIEI